MEIEYVPVGWEKLTAADIASAEPRSIVSGPFGSSIGSRFFVESGVPVIRGNNLSFGDVKFRDDGFVFLSHEKAQEFKNCRALPGDVVFTAAGTLGQVGLIPERPRHPFYIISNKQLRLRLDTERCHPTFLFYWFIQPQMRAHIIQSNRGSSVPLITLGVLRSLPVLLPPLETQRRIATILEAYDDLIEVNRRRMAVLEEMARGLFEELLRSPIEGPTIGELYEASLGGDWGAEEADDEHRVKVRVVRGTDIPRLQNGDYSSCPQRFISSKSAVKRVLQTHDLVLENSINAKTRPAGTTLLVTAGLLEELGGDAIAASFCRVFKFKSLRTALLVHHYCRHLHRTREIERFQTVAANGIANFQTQVFLKECRLPVDVEANAEALSLLESLHEGGSLIGRQTSRLAASRDLLLPRLISGQLSVEAAERELEDAA